jgi:hypothetical protein
MHKYYMVLSRAESQMTMGIRFLLIGILLSAVSFNGAFAQGDLLISPLRVVFEGTKKSQVINLANVGKDTAIYVISVVDIKMRDDGTFEQVTVPDSGQNFAGKYLRFFPRRVVLAPNEAQVVKIQLVKTNELMPGEYRSHLYFRSVPEETPAGEKKQSKDTSGLSVHLVPIFGITTPVIIRVGENNSAVTLSDFSLDLKDTIPRVSITLNRTGNMSVYGDIKVEFISAYGKVTQVKLARGVSVYAPNAFRRLRIELDKDKNVDYRMGKLRLTYTLQAADKSVKVVQTELPLI